MSFVNGHADGITALRYDSQTVQISCQGTCGLARNPSWLAVALGGEHVYAVSEVDELDGARTGGVSAFRVSDDANDFELLNSMSSGGTFPTHLAVTPDRRFLLVANFGSGTVAAFALASDGSLVSMTDIVQHCGRGKDDFFQAGPHPHQIVFDPLTTEIAIPDMGLDAVFFYRLDATGQLSSSRAQAKLPPGTGPRQIAFTTDGQCLIVLGEVNSTLSVLRRQPSGAFSITQCVNTVPDDFAGKTRAGGLAMTPDGRRIFATNRGHDSVAVYSWDPRVQALCHEETIACGGREPRGLAVTPGGETLIVANQDSDELVAFAIGETGLDPRDRIASPSPACILFLPDSG